MKDRLILFLERTFATFIGGLAVFGIVSYLHGTMPLMNLAKADELTIGPDDVYQYSLHGNQCIVTLKTGEIISTDVSECAKLKQAIPERQVRKFSQDWG